MEKTLKLIILTVVILISLIIVSIGFMLLPDKPYSKKQLIKSIFNCQLHKKARAVIYVRTYKALFFTYRELSGLHFIKF